MRTRDARILIVPGLGDSGEGHWQSRWQARLPTARRVTMPSWTEPEAAGWVGAIRAALAEPDERPVVLIAHSLGAVAVALALAGGSARVAGAFLVTPPSEASVRDIPEIGAGFLPFPRTPLPCPATLVGSRTDPYCPLADAEALARDWGATFIDAGEAGHINDASGHGPWPEGLMSFAGFLGKL